MKKSAPFGMVEFLLKYWSGILGLGAAFVTIIVFLATLAPRLSATENQNKLQDQAIIELKKSTEIWLQMYQQQQQAPNQAASRGLREYDEYSNAWWCCELEQRDACYEYNAWYQC